MVDMECKPKLSSSQPSPKSRNNPDKPRLSTPPPVHFADTSSSSSSSPSPSSCLAYEQYIRLSELTALWTAKSFPEWENESLVKPALQALEITFRFISIVLSDPRPYANRPEWTRRLESLATHQLQLISLLCEDDHTAPTADLSSSRGVLTRQHSSEVWNCTRGASKSHVVSKISDASLLPRLATWRKSEAIASKIAFVVECEMMRCPYTLGLGEPNLSGKPGLEYDMVCKPADLHSIKKPGTRYDHFKNQENQNVFTIHQILETWIHVAREVIGRIENQIDGGDFIRAEKYCWLLERIWKLLAEIEELHLATDPCELARLKKQLLIPSYFLSGGLVEITRLCSAMGRKLPWIDNEEAAMELYRGRRREDTGKVELMQALQAVELGVKGFYFTYRQVIGVVMGSVSDDTSDPLYRMYSEPTWFAGLDGAKTRLGEFWRYENGNLKG